MAWPYDDESSGPYGSVSQVPTDTWFGVDTATGQWQRPGQPTLGAVSGADLGLGLDLDLTTAFPGAGQGYGVQAPGTPSLGQVTGIGRKAPTASALTRPAGRESLSAFLPKEPTVWESIARGVGMATPQGRAILQGYDQQAQQGLTNRLALRRQQLLEEQNDRAEIRDDFNNLLKISEIKSKSLRKLYTDRYVADLQARGKTLPPDFVEAFKASGSDEAKAMVQFYQPLLQDLGLDPTAFAELVGQGGIKEVGEALTLAQKLKKDKTEQARLDALDRVGAGETLGDVSGVQAPASAPTTPAPTTPTATGSTGRTGTVAPEIATAVTETVKLFPQVREDLVRSMIRHESNYNVGAVSPKGATGLMQLMPGTAKEQGVDDPKDPVQNVRGGTRYFAQMLTKYHGNEALALAAYNWGPGNVDKVQGDLTKMPAETQAYVKNVLASAASGQRGPAGTQGQVAGPGAPAPTTPTGGTPQEQAQLMALNTRIATLDKQIEGYTKIGGEEGRGRATATERQRDNLAQERDRLRTRMLEPTRAAERLEASKQTGAAAAETSLRLEGEKRIGPDVGRKLNLPASTKWKDVPADRMSIEDPSATERKGLTDLRAGVAGVERLLGMLDNPEVQKMVGTFFTEPEATANRVLGQWLSTLSPEQRKFGATLASEIMEIRHRLIGAGQTGIEVSALSPMMPSPGDTDVNTLRAKLEALREGMLRRHDASRDDLEGMGYRVPAKLAPPAAKPPLDPKAQQALDILKPKGK
jgi:hypothetical protein